MNRDIGVTVATSNSLFHQENMDFIESNFSFSQFRSAFPLRKVTSESC